MTSAVGSRGTLAGSTCIGDGGLVVRVASLATGAAAWGAGADGIMRERDEKNWGGS